MQEQRSCDELIELNFLMSKKRARSQVDIRRTPGTKRNSFAEIAFLEFLVAQKSLKTVKLSFAIHLSKYRILE